jgi:hypothetical protein
MRGPQVALIGGSLRSVSTGQTVTGFITGKNGYQ